MQRVSTLMDNPVFVAVIAGASALSVGAAATITGWRTAHD